MTSGRFSAHLFSSLKTVLSKPRPWWLVAVFWLVLVAPAQAALELRVAIKDGVSQVKVGSSTKAAVRDGSGRPLGEIAASSAFFAQANAGKIALDKWQAGQIWIEPAEGGFVWIGDRWYRGRTLLVPTAKGLTAVNYVDLEQYLYSVLGGEMNGNWPQEALKAQAVAARSYALYQRQSSANAVYDVGDTAAWQVYDGIADESRGTQMAVDATLGQVLTYQGRIIEAVFHSSSGGRTENVEDVWVQALPYLRSVAGYDEGTPNYQWQKTFSSKELGNLISGVGMVKSIQPRRRTPGGRVVTLEVLGDAGTRSISGESLRQALGLKSTLFDVTPQFDPVASTGKLQSSPISFQFNGRGFGHGLGMSQWGAYNLAQRGYNYQQILLHYYVNTALARIQVQ